MRVQLQINKEGAKENDTVKPMFPTRIFHEGGPVDYKNAIIFQKYQSD